MSNEGANSAEVGPQALTIRFLRACCGWSQKELARQSGLHAKLISEYERGDAVPTRAQLDRLATSAAVPLSFVEGFARTAFELGFGKPNGGSTPTAAARKAGTQEEFDPNALAEEVAQGVASAILPALAARALRLKALRDPSPDQALAQRDADRAHAAGLWQRLAPHSPEKRLLLAETAPVFRAREAWALVERICVLCLDVAGDDPNEALELLNLADRVIECLKVSEGFRTRLRGYAGFFEALAHRAANDEVAVEKALTLARKQFADGATHDPGLLSEAQVFNLDVLLTETA